MTLVKRILRHAQETIGLGLRIREDSSLWINTFSDTDWAGCLDDRRSTSGFAIYLGSNLLSWSAHKQVTMSRDLA
jgi:hypothetical protein